ncbi:MAG TPA: TSUP family transporter [Candidatus Krumholzibacteria bacterium]|nr:TSUP family transporter [Candidatus Krumholzibacteria bacterium]
MTMLVVCAVALAASGLTFFSGFGLGTLLLPVFALFFPIEEAVALTAVVHFLNGLFKLGLVGRHADRGVVLRFGLPAILAAFAGAALLHVLAGLPPVGAWSLGGRTLAVTPIKLTVGLLLLAFAGLELLPGADRLAFDRRWLPVGGVLSGFFGGLSGMQGALRSAFLARAGLTKEAFVATGVTVSVLIDFTRLGMYGRVLKAHAAELDWLLLGAAVLAAFAGALLGNLYLKKLTMGAVRRIVAAMLLLVGLGLAGGLL